MKIMEMEKKNSMASNPALTIMQLELALNNLQNTMIDETGKLAVDSKFLELFDSIMEKLQESRAIAESKRKD